MDLKPFTILQVSSAVPEGKGVSSSAAVEVATMSAVAAAHGLYFFPEFKMTQKKILSAFFWLNASWSMKLDGFSFQD